MLRAPTMMSSGTTSCVASTLPCTWKSSRSSCGTDVRFCVLFCVALRSLHPSLFASLPVSALGVAGRAQFEYASNNWVINGSLTDTGASYLANDPHLSFSTPSIWMLVHLSAKDTGMAFLWTPFVRALLGLLTWYHDGIIAPGYNAIGGSFPGIPGLATGRNDHIAWGITTCTDDSQVGTTSVNLPF